MEDQLLSSRTELSKLGVKDIIYKYLRFLPLFIISVIVCFVAAMIYLRYTTPMYQSSASLVIRQDNEMGGDAKFNKMFRGAEPVNIDNEIEYLRSQPLMARVVKAMNLNFNYYAIGNVKEQNIYKNSPFSLHALTLKDTTASYEMLVTFENNTRFRINEEKKLITFGESFQTPEGTFQLIRNPKNSLANKEYSVTWQPTSVIASTFINQLVVSPKTSVTDIIMVVLQTPNPVLSADVVNRLIEEYQKAVVEEKNITTEQTLTFITDRLKVVEGELDAATSQLTNYQRSNNIINLDVQSGNFLSRIEEMDRELNTQRVQLRVAQEIEKYLKNTGTSYGLVPSSLGLQDPTLNTLVSAYNVAVLERSTMLEGNIAAGSPLILQKEEQIEKLRKSLIENLQNVKIAYNNSIRNLEVKTSSIQGEIQMLPPKQQLLIEMQRQKESKQAVYDYLAEKREESAIGLASTISNVRLLESAVPNSTPVKPNRRSVQLLSLIIGLIIPTLFIFILEILDDKINTRYDIEKITPASIIGELGHSFDSETVVVTNTNRSVIAEQFRIIRSNLQYLIPNIKKPVILITSSGSGEGKSFITINMGAAIALSGKKTVILEFDIRKPRLLSGLNMTKKPGITNYILGKIPLEELAIQVPNSENLFVIPCGPTPPNPAEMLLSPKLNDLFEYIHQNFDVAIVDTAPIGLVSDAMTLGKFADCTFYIVRQRQTFKKQIGLLDELYREQKLPNVSIILNDVKARTGYGYYGYGRYGYGRKSGYGDSSAYYDDVQKTQTGFLKGWFGANGKSKKTQKTSV